MVVCLANKLLDCLFLPISQFGPVEYAGHTQWYFLSVPLKKHVLLEHVFCWKQNFNKPVHPPINLFCAHFAFGFNSSSSQTSVSDELLVPLSQLSLGTKKDLFYRSFVITLAWFSYYNFDKRANLNLHRILLFWNVQEIYIYIYIYIHLSSV